MSIILIILILATLIVLNFKVTPPRYNYQTIRPYLKTGDIILFSCNYYDLTIANLEYGFRTKLLGSEYGHVGIIVRDPSGRLYLLECTGHTHTAYKQAKHFNKQGKGGLRVIDFDVLVEKYYQENNALFAVMFINKEIPNSLILSKIDKYKNRIFENKNILVPLALVDIFLSHSISKKMLEFLENKGDERFKRIMCSEFVYSILYDCGVVEKYPAKLFWPHLVSNDKLKKLSNYKYHGPVKFFYKDDL